MVLVESFSGVRGIYNQDLDNKIAARYALAYLKLLNKKNPIIVIGRDTRPSSEQIANSQIRALGCQIIDVGIASTPLIENAVRVSNADGGIIITASHNEPEFNGFKFLEKDGAILSPDKMEQVIKNFHNIKNSTQSEPSIILKKQKHALNEYKKFLKNIVKIDNLENNLKILIDPNGGAGVVSKEIFEEYKINGVYINMVKGEFKRLVEPNQNSLSYLKDKINDLKCDFALGFDCDADRVEILLKDGSLVSGNDILALIADEILSSSNKKEKNVVVNDATSYIVKEITEKNNAFWNEVEVGEVNVVNKMSELNALIGGEGSNGGVIIPDSKCRDGIMTLLILLKIIKKKRKTLEDLIKELPKYYYLKYKTKIKEDFASLKDSIKKYYLDNGFEILETGDKTGGLKAIKNNSWVWFRQSKTENNVLRIISDSRSEEEAKELLEEAKKLII